MSTRCNYHLLNTSIIWHVAIHTQPATTFDDSPVTISHSLALLCMMQIKLCMLGTPPFACCCTEASLYIIDRCIERAHTVTTTPTQCCGAGKGPVINYGEGGTTKWENPGSGTFRAPLKTGSNFSPPPLFKGVNFLWSPFSILP